MMFLKQYLCQKKYKKSLIARIHQKIFTEKEFDYYIGM